MKDASTRRIWLIFMIMISMLIVSVAGVYADDTCEISVSPNVTGIEVTRGGSEQIDLSEVFSDSLGHDMSYTLDESEDSLKARIKDGILLIDPREKGEFEIKITAKCTVTGEEKQVTLPVSIVESQDEGNPAQYGYDETPADSVNVTVTFSSDGIPLRGNDADNTVIAHLDVTVPYFDLGLYGLEKFYRYHTENGRGEYIDDEIVERPTAMHLMIYMTERYYMGLPEEECCKGTSGILTYMSSSPVYNMNGEKAYDSRYPAYELTGDATSSYMHYLWGHDENLMYYRNHVFPLMSPGYGSTSDYQLLSDGNTFDLGMYTNWEFHYSGAFCKFDQESYETETGKLTGFSTLYASSSWNQSGSFSPMKGLELNVYDDEWNLVGTSESESAGFEYTFNEPGKYYIVGQDVNGGTNQASKAPATAVVKVKDAFKEYPFEKIADPDGNVLSQIEKIEDLGWVDLYHVKVPRGTESIDIFWKGLEEKELLQKSWDFRSMEVHDEESAFTRDGAKITTSPSKWDISKNALLVMDNDNNYYGAFTFEYYTPEHFNFAPVLKEGIEPTVSVKIREHKTYKIDLSEIFMDLEGDEMTYEVSVDGSDPLKTEQEFTYDTGDPSSHVLVFTPTDSKGLAGETYTVNLKVTKNVLPEYADRKNTESEAAIRNFETAELDLLTVFSDVDNDDMTFRVSTDGGEFGSFTPEHTQTYVNTILGGYNVDHLWFRFKPDEGSGPQTHVYRFKAADEYGEGSDIYTYTVKVVDNLAPVPEQEEVTAYMMSNHYFFFDPQQFFSDPEGDRILSYTVSENGGPETTCRRNLHNGMWNAHNFLVGEDEKYTLTFYSTDVHGAKGKCVVNIYTVPEVLHELTVDRNAFDAGKDGPVIYEDGAGEQGIRIDGYKVSEDVTLRGVKYSEYDGDYNYYLDVDGDGISEGDTYSVIVDGNIALDRITNSWGSETIKSINIDASDNDVMAKIVYPGKSGTTYTYRCYRLITHITDPGEIEPEEISIEWKDDELRDNIYAGELISGYSVKMRYTDGIERYIDDYESSDESFSTPGSHTLTVTARGISHAEEIDVKEVPDDVKIVNDLGKYGRVRLIRLTDENDQKIEGAALDITGPVLDPGYDDSKYDGENRNGVPNMLRNSYGISVRVPMTYDQETVKIAFEMIHDTPASIQKLEGDNTEYTRQGLGVVTKGTITVPVTEGKGESTASWFDIKDASRYRWHSYDAFNIKVKTGACEIIGKVSSWEDKGNAEFLAYPDSMTEEEVRSDAMGERAAMIQTSTTLEDAVENGDRYEQAFKVEGLDAGTYKLAVVKPGKYVVKIVTAEIDGTDDVGTLELRLFGDVTNDGKIKAGDATQIARYVVGSRDLTEEESLSADVTLDGKVKIGDATQVVRYVVGKGSSLDDIQ